jgi:uncharacterized protein (UPF0212 family)
MAREFPAPDICPVCGNAVPRGARACPGCGADERSGWDADAARYDGLGLPDEVFEENSRGDTPRVFWSIVGIGLVVLLICFFILR